MNSVPSHDNGWNSFSLRYFLGVRVSLENHLVACWPELSAELCHLVFIIRIHDTRESGDEKEK